MGRIADEFVTVTSDPMDGVNDAKVVEECLEKTCMMLKLEISLSFDKKYFGIIQGFQR